MIGSWFALGSVWTWEVAAADGTVVASGVAADEVEAGWECRMAILVAGQELGGSAGREAAELALPSDAARFDGRWSASRSWVAA